MRIPRTTRLAVVVLAVAGLVVTPAAAHADDGTRSVADQMTDFTTALLSSCNGPVASVLPAAQSCSFSAMSLPLDASGDTVPVDPDFAPASSPVLGDDGTQVPPINGTITGAITPDKSRLEQFVTGPPTQITQYYFNCSNSSVDGVYAYQHKVQTTQSESTTISRSYEIDAEPLGLGASITITASAVIGHTWDKATWSGSTTYANLLRWNAGWVDVHPVYVVSQGYAKIVLAAPVTAPNGTTSAVWWVRQNYSQEVNQETATDFGPYSKTESDQLETESPHTRALRPQEISNCLNGGYQGAPPLTDQIVAAQRGADGQAQCLTMGQVQNGTVPVTTVPVTLADCASDTTRATSDADSLVSRQQFAMVPMEPDAPGSKYAIENLATNSCLTVGAATSGAGGASTVTGDAACNDTQNTEGWRLSAESGLATWKNDGTSQYLTVGADGSVVLAPGVTTSNPAAQWGRTTADVLTSS